MDESSQFCSAVIYDLEKNSITYVRVGSKWLSIDELAAKRVIPPNIIEKEILVLLFNRLKNALKDEDLDVLEEDKDKKILERMLNLVSEHSGMDTNELISYLNAILKEKSKIEILGVLSVMAREANVPFEVFVKQLMEES